ncbi:MAG: hypothetical protein ABI585_03105 [Betaproteobacteria bacterium]
MPRSLQETSRRGPRASALAVLFTALVAVVAPPAESAVSPYPPIALGNVLVGGQLQADVTVPLSLKFSDVPASFDATVLFTSVGPADDLVLSLIGLSSPLTVGGIKAVFPNWTVTIPVPTTALDQPSGMYALSPLGCDASQCTYRATFAPTTAGTFTAQLVVGVASVTIQDGGLLGAIVNALLPFMLGVINAALVYDFTGTGLAQPAVTGANAVPGPGGTWLAVVAALVAAAGMAAIARRRASRIRADER